MHKRQRVLEELLKYGGLGASLFVWWAVLRWDSSPAMTCSVVVGGVLLVFPITLVSRRILDRHATGAFAERSAGVIHYLVMIPLGAAIFKALQVVKTAPGATMPIPTPVGLTLVVAQSDDFRLFFSFSPRSVSGSDPFGSCFGYGCL